MIISDLKIDSNNNVKRLSAKVVWENCSKPDRILFFEVDHKYSEALKLSYDPFLAAAIIPAMFAGEQRVKICGEVCPFLVEGVKTNLYWLKYWYGFRGNLLTIDYIPAKEKASFSNNRTGSFLSGGIDSLYTLRSNHLHYPIGHPGRIRDGIIVFGFDMGGLESHSENRELYNLAIESLKNIAQDTGINLISVTTNIRYLNDDTQFWMYKSHGACLAAVALALSNRLNLVLIGSSYDIPYIRSWGTHPVIDYNYSSYTLKLKHDGVQYSRLAKTKIVTEWPIALNNIRVCTSLHSTTLNCGKCEKCIRTIYALDALKKLKESTSFSYSSASPMMLKNILIGSDYGVNSYKELIPIFKEQSKIELVKAINSALKFRTDYQRKRKFIANLKKFDKVIFNGYFMSIWKKKMIVD